MFLGVGKFPPGDSTDGTRGRPAGVRATTSRASAEDPVPQLGRQETEQGVEQHEEEAADGVEVVGGRDAVVDQEDGGGVGGSGTELAGIVATTASTGGVTEEFTS
jgi:hypothetical protein